mgnify:CR=1 FL=1
MPSVMLSIRPKYVYRIMRGEKTCEVRKTKPRLETPFICHVYATKGKDRLFDVIKDGDMNYGEVYHGKPVFIKLSEPERYQVPVQHVVGSFVCDKIIEVTPETLGEQIKNGELNEFSTSLTVDEFMKYMGKKCYLWHISNYASYRPPKQLSDFMSYGAVDGHYMKVPPQSWCYIEECKT